VTQPPERAGPPVQVVVMGVTGTGKSTIAALVAGELGVALIEGDSYHPRRNIEKMSSGRPLTDDDRRPWLQTLAGLLVAERRAGRSAVLACSALRRSYRDILRGDAAADATFFVHLHADVQLLEQRMRSREHFMPPSLLRSQVDSLEPLADDEEGVQVDVAAPTHEVMGRVREALRKRTTDVRDQPPARGSGWHPPAEPPPSS
jgi:gluconokinase